MNENLFRFLQEHNRLSRRFFVAAGIASATAISVLPVLAGEDANPELREAIANLEPWLTPPDDFRDVSRGNPKPHTLSQQKRKEVGLTRDSWKLNVISDPDNPASIMKPLRDESAFTFEDLMTLAKDRAVRFPKVMTCLNIGCPLGMGIWEGVPLRDVIWKTQPKENLRRVFYYGYHNEKPEQMFRSSLPVGRILEDPFDLPPVILCYKLNGQWLSPERGGPVRVVVPESYGFKSIKWLTNVVLSNLAVANDTYAEKNNDVDSHLKTFCATLNVPRKVQANDVIPVTGWAQVGISGLAKVQVWITEQDVSLPKDDAHFTTAPWQDATILKSPNEFLGSRAIPSQTMHFDADGKPTTWPLPLSKVHWCFRHNGLPAGKYVLRCRTVDANGNAQPMPRPFRKSGHAKIEQIRFEVG